MHLQGWSKRTLELCQFNRCYHLWSFAGSIEVSGGTVLSARSSLSSAATTPRGHSFYTLFTSISSIVRLRRRRSTLTRYNPGHALPQVRLFLERRGFYFHPNMWICYVFIFLLVILFLQVHLMALPSAFGVKFHKCAQVRRQNHSNNTHFSSVSPLNSRN